LLAGVIFTTLLALVLYVFIASAPSSFPAIYEFWCQKWAKLYITVEGLEGSILSSSVFLDHEFMMMSRARK